MFKVRALHKTIDGTVVLELEIGKEIAANLIEYAIADLMDKGGAYIEEGEEKDAYKLYISEPEGNG